MTADLTLLTELNELTSALLAHAEWQYETGATGLPPATHQLQLIRGACSLPPLPPQRQPPSGLRPSRTGEAPQARTPKVRLPPPLAASDPGTPKHIVERVALEASGMALATAPSATAELEPSARPAVASDETPSTAAPAATRVPPFPSLPAGENGEARGRRLELLRGEVSLCTRCGLHSERKNTVFSRGTGASGVCFVGEGPGADEDEQGLPFVGAAGQLLDKMITAMGLARDDVYVCNIVKCRPPNNRKPEPEEMRTCTPYLTEQLELVSPQVIVAMGATAVQGLLGTSGGITRLRGTWRLYRGKIAVMPTFHPAYLLRQPSAKKLVWEDLQAVLKHLGRTIPQR